MKWWSQPIRVEDPNIANLCTSKTVNSALWFVNNRRLTRRILAYLAKYQEKYGVEIYAFVVLGNHYHLCAVFPHANRSAFFRDFNARIAEAVRELVPGFLGGPLMGRRYTSQVLPLESDIENYFYYCALQPVSSGLTERISEYPGYNSFNDAIRGIGRKFKLVDRASFHARSRASNHANIKDFTKEYTLTYSRLPEYGEMGGKEYKELLLRTMETRRVELVNKRKKAGKSFHSRKELESVRPGSIPKTTKQGGLRPVVLTACSETRKQVLCSYMAIVRMYRDASLSYLNGDETVAFPPGTYKPPGPWVTVN